VSPFVRLSSFHPSSLPVSAHEEEGDPQEFNDEDETSTMGLELGEGGSEGGAARNILPSTMIHGVVAQDHEEEGWGVSFQAVQRAIQILNDSNEDALGSDQVEYLVQQESSRSSTSHGNVLSNRPSSRDVHDAVVGTGSNRLLEILVSAVAVLDEIDDEGGLEQCGHVQNDARKDDSHQV
jgi:hypothetical protein